jgi:hypothetical protein
VILAKGKFQCLYIKTTNKFQDFLLEFSYLIQESGLAEPEWKEELYYCINVDLQRSVMRESTNMLRPTLDLRHQNPARRKDMAKGQIRKLPLPHMVYARV